MLTALTLTIMQTYARACAKANSFYIDAICKFSRKWYSLTHQRVLQSESSSGQGIYFILFYFILFYFILFYFILFYFILGAPGWAVVKRPTSARSRSHAP